MRHETVRFSYHDLSRARLCSFDFTQGRNTVSSLLFCSAARPLSNYICRH
jgi:hypothetical protein